MSIRFYIEEIPLGYDPCSGEMVYDKQKWVAIDELVFINIDTMPHTKAEQLIQETTEVLGLVGVS